MKGTIQTGFGDPGEVLRIGEVDMPVVDDDGVLTQVSQDDRVTIEGRVGLGKAPWFDEFRLPTDRQPVPGALVTRPEVRG